MDQSLPLFIALKPLNARHMFFYKQKTFTRIHDIDFLYINVIIKDLIY